MTINLGIALGLLSLIVLALRVYFAPGLAPKQRLPWAVFTLLVPVIGFVAFLFVHGYRRPPRTTEAGTAPR